MIQPKPAVRELVRVSEQEPSRLFRHRMDRNERTHPFSAAFLRRFRAGLSGELMMTYPEPEPLYEEFSAWLGVPRDRLLFHTGSDLAIKAIYETYISPGDRILLHRPGYAMYPVYARMFQAEVEYLDYDEDLRFDLARYTRMLTRSHRMVVLENPNGFVGNQHVHADIRALVARAQELGVLAVLDEAYFHFIDQTAAEWLDEFDNLVVVRTFSKAFGLAGLRAAYFLSRPENIASLRRVKPMHELNALAIHAVRTLLAMPKELGRFVRETRESREQLQSALEELGFQTSRSRANFLAARFGTRVDGTALAGHLAGRGFLIRRPFREKHLWEWSRVGTLPLSAQKKMVAELKSYLAGRPHAAV